MKVLATRIRVLRDNHKFSQTELGDLVGASKQTISNYEKETSSPDNETLIKLAYALNTSTDYLLGKTDNPAIDFDSEFIRLKSWIDENQPLINLSKKITDNNIDLRIIEAYIDGLINKSSK